MQRLICPLAVFTTKQRLSPSFCNAVSAAFVAGARFGAAAGGLDGMGFSADKSVAKAEETALTNCTGYTANCLITMSFCNEGG